jgi:hypothetical protein
MKLEFSLQIFEKFSYIKFNENSSSGSRVVPCGQIEDGVDEANGRFSHFFAKTPNWTGINKESLTACSNIDPISSFNLLSRVFLL